MEHKKRRRRINPFEFGLNTVIYLILIIVGIITLFPVVYSLLGAFKSTQELMTSGSILPKQYTLDNYKYVLDKIDFSRYAFNSLFVSVMAVLTSTLMATTTAYTFSRRNFVGKKLIKTMYLATMFIGAGAATMYPTYKLLVDLGINKNYLGLIFLNCGAPVPIILLCESYLKGISKDFDDAAKIDGCSFFRIYAQIIMPMLMPMVAVNALLTFRGVWNSYLMPMIVTAGQPKLQLLTVAIVELKTGGGLATMWSTILAAVNISLIPIIIVYVLCNKQFIRGIAEGGLKG
ncbi:MAG: carbohydrate ABC transporter permease [Clostridia bacterium]|nr:carbohydrate ABC transporter permease [Clostridia bacterium]